MVDLRMLFDQLIRFETELWNGIDARLRADLDLPLSWFEPMQVIDRVESCRVFDIASSLAITVGGTSKLVDRIEAAGHCERRANPGDRRSSIIELTPTGQLLLMRAVRVFDEELQTRIGSVLSEGSIQQFGDALTKLRSAATPAPASKGLPHD